MTECARLTDALALAALRQREDENPECVAAVHLLLLTGCRPGRFAACAGARSSPIGWR